MLRRAIELFTASCICVRCARDRASLTRSMKVAILACIATHARRRKRHGAVDLCRRSIVHTRACPTTGQLSIVAGGSPITNAEIKRIMTVHFHRADWRKVAEVVKAWREMESS